MRLREKVLPYFNGKDGHGFDHVDRVYRMALNLCENEDADIDVVRAACLLHDVARSKEDMNNNICHAEEGARMAPRILEEVNFPHNKINDVVHAIAVHRYSKGLEAKTKEAEILQDADRLDALGAVILGRMMEFVVKNNTCIYNEKGKEYNECYGPRSTVIGHIYGKLLKITPDSFKTVRAKEIAKGRYDFVKEFAERYIGEIEGKI